MADAGTEFTLSEALELVVFVFLLVYWARVIRQEKTLSESTTIKAGQKAGLWSEYSMFQSLKRSEQSSGTLSICQYYVIRSETLVLTAQTRGSTQHTVHTRLRGTRTVSLRTGNYL